MSEIITKKMIKDYQELGVVYIPNLFKKHVSNLKKGIEFNLNNPGPYAAENLRKKENGRFFDDYCNWERIPEFRKTIFDNEIITAAAKLMQSQSVQLFHDHVLVKEPGTSKDTPWHSDGPYYFINGKKTISFWVPLDPVKEASLRMVARSHKWGKQVLPTKWLSQENFYEKVDQYLPIPDPDMEDMDVLEFQMEPGDAVAFHFEILHGARGNNTTNRRRAFSLRLVGDDVCYTERPGKTSPPFPNHNMNEGDKLRSDWFPILLPSGS